MFRISPFSILSLLHILVSVIVNHHLVGATSEKSDFVVVGAGTSGCVLAARLCTALPNAKITLLERGLERNETAEFLVRSPRMVIDVQLSDAVAEVWSSLPNQGLMGRETGIVTGKTLGGSSAINAMQWTVPLGDTVDRWNISGLSTSTAARFYRLAYQTVGFAQQPRRLRPIYGDDFVTAGTKSGFTAEFDPFDHKIRSSTWVHSVAVTKTGRRIDSCTAYLSPVIQNQCSRNLRLIQGVTVTRLILSDDRPRHVIGVEYVHSNDKTLKNKKQIKVEREVLLAAGPYGSPKILQLSGIGPKDHLLRVGIEPKVDLGVGTRSQARAVNFATSVYNGMPLEPSNNSTILNSDRTLRRWKNGKSSVLGTNPASVLSVLNGEAYSAMGTASNGEGLDVPVMSSLCLINPTSFGYVRIKDSNPFSFPDVQLNILGTEKDVQRLKGCVEKMIGVHNKFPPSFQMTLLSPTGGVTEAFLRNTSAHGYHFVGGCAVGRVLEPNLKVRGVRGIRVIDSSVFSTIPTTAGPLASTYMLAEYASEKLSSLYRCTFNSKRMCHKQGNLENEW